MLFLALSLLVLYKGAVLVVIDGAGESPWHDGNSLLHADTPTLNYLKQHFPYVSLVAAQQPVGLIRGEPGSSAVGHQTLGLGRTTPSYYQTLMATLKPDAPNSLRKNELLRSSFNQAKKKGARIHFAGQCTDAGVFAHTRFLRPMFEAAQDEGIDEAYVHCFLMSMSRKASSYLHDVDQVAPLGFKPVIGSVHCADTAMDKSRNWNWTGMSYRALIGHDGMKFVTREEAEHFLDGFSDASPFFTPVSIEKDAVLRENDVIVLFNFREDKSYQIAEALIHGLPGYEKLPKNLHVIPMILYSTELHDIPTLLPAVKYSNSIGSWISKHGFKQLRLAESYKRPHVTTFFSGGVLQPVFEGEDRIIFDSVPDIQAQFNPKMNASLVTETAKKAIANGTYKLIMMNFANVDATGHSGNSTAVTMAITHVDKMVKEILHACEKNDYALFVTADHGNGEENENLDGSRQVAHTVNNVPFMTNLRGYRVHSPIYGDSYFLGNVAPTILYVLGMKVPPEMVEPMMIRETERRATIIPMILSFFAGAVFMLLLLVNFRNTQVISKLYLILFAPDKTGAEVLRDV